eukprot:CAMPEP_0114173542 /NCGR_PEP_ID=MMETSP0043_2-20121206/35898_1 /TAXON_ID=464988 /ORGANISM="Hemiselmis andersenii, Strain CCMP644" /LENGTH=219 /DNA_ID=CAMNT_0001271559 /DNA_START=244 /DNA_END=899 /DNA_ORIENTATION=+
MGTPRKNPGTASQESMERCSSRIGLSLVQKELAVEVLRVLQGWCSSTFFRELPEELAGACRDQLPLFDHCADGLDVFVGPPRRHCCLSGIKSTTSTRFARSVKQSAQKAATSTTQNAPPAQSGCKERGGYRAGSRRVAEALSNLLFRLVEEEISATSIEVWWKVRGPRHKSTQPIRGPSVRRLRNFGRPQNHALGLEELVVLEDGLGVVFHSHAGAGGG